MIPINKKILSSYENASTFQSNLLTVSSPEEDECNFYKDDESSSEDETETINKIHVTCMGNLTQTLTKDNNKTQLYLKAVVQTIINSQNQAISPISALGQGSNKTINKIIKIYINEKEKSFAISYGNIKTPDIENNEFLKQEIINICQIEKMNLKGSMKTWGIVQNEETGGFIYVQKLYTAGAFNEYSKNIDDADGFDLLATGWDHVKEFHDAGTFHGDIKLSNFLIHKNKIYLSDYGTVIFDNKWVPRKVSIAILDPYAFKNDRYGFNPKSDTYAFGLAICQFYRRNTHNPINPDKKGGPIEVHTWLMHQDMTPVQCQYAVELMINETPFPYQGIKNLVIKMMAYLPEDRPSDEEVQNTFEILKKNPGDYAPGQSAEPYFLSSSMISTSASSILLLSEPPLFFPSEGSL